MTKSETTQRDRDLAQKCIDCNLCISAREKQSGFAYWIVKLLERGICPACKAYERVYGCKAHEPFPGDPS